jgi:hypothetical protein
MVRPVLVALALAALLVGGAAAARAQGLGDVAARERHKREAEKTKEPGRVYDNDDLPSHDQDKAGKGKEETKPGEPAPASSGEPGGGDAASVAAARKARIDQAQGAVDAAQGQIDTIQARIRELQDMLNPMSPSYIYGSRASGDMAGAEARVRTELTQQEARLADARKLLDAAKQELEDAQLGRSPSPPSSPSS